jgi:hypothetical protein
MHALYSKCNTGVRDFNPARAQVRSVLVLSS